MLTILQYFTAIILQIKYSQLLYECVAIQLNINYKNYKTKNVGVWYTKDLLTQTIWNYRRVTAPCLLRHNVYEKNYYIDYNNIIQNLEF